MAQKVAQKEKKNWHKWKLDIRHIGMTVGVGVLLCLVVVLLIVRASNRTPHVEVITQSFLERIVSTSNLSTYEAVYNGITSIAAEDDPEEILYYVSYCGAIKAGFDFEQIDIQIDEQNKQVLVALPLVKITDVFVDIASMEYIFMDDDANTETVSQEAYRTCVDDATRQSVEQPAIRQLAKQNAQNVLSALLEPFVAQMEGGYSLSFVTEGK